MARGARYVCIICVDVWSRGGGTASASAARGNELSRRSRPLLSSPLPPLPPSHCLTHSNLRSACRTIVQQDLCLSFGALTDVVPQQSGFRHALSSARVRTCTGTHSTSVRTVPRGDRPAPNNNNNSALCVRCVPRACGSAVQKKKNRANVCMISRAHTHVWPALGSRMDRGEAAFAGGRAVD